MRKIVREKSYGELGKWLSRRLQIFARRFDSGTRLHISGNKKRGKNPVKFKWYLIYLHTITHWQLLPLESQTQAPTTQPNGGKGLNPQLILTGFR